MRQAGQLQSEADARRFSDWLLVQGIDNEADAGDGGEYRIWIVEDEQLEAATAALERFKANPRAPEFEAGAKARRVREDAVREAREAKKRIVNVRGNWGSETSVWAIPVTAGLVMASVYVTWLNHFGGTRQVAPYFIAAYKGLLGFHLRQGEVWRLVTPIFIHMSIMHIVFNMMWTIDFGKLIEPRKGSFYYAAMILFFAVPSNLLQYWADGPRFGGMSGVVFGLCGYVWIYNKFLWRETYPFDPWQIKLMLIWFVICTFGWVGPIANWAHGGGLAAGMAWGYFTSDHFKRAAGIK